MSDQKVSHPDGAWITVKDGERNMLWHTKTGKTKDNVRLAQHAMRFHVHDPDSNTATEQYYNTTPELFTRLSTFMVKHSMGLYRASSWITLSMKNTELWPADKWKKMAQKELEESEQWGEVEVTGAAVRYIRYTSDGTLSRTPDAIGMYGGRPLIFRGKTVAVIFKLNGQDVLSPNNNVAYLLPKKWWNGFHTKYRNVQKEFPSPGRLGFVATNWCQRHGHSGYGQGIWLASMTQNHSLSTWSATQLRAWWQNRGGINGDEYTLIGRSNKKVLSAEQKQSVATTAIVAQLVKGAQLGRIGTVCITCGNVLLKPYGYCSACKANNSTGHLEDHHMCSKCGLSTCCEQLCKCDEVGNDESGGDTHYNHYKEMMAKYKEVTTEWMKKLQS